VPQDHRRRDRLRVLEDDVGVADADPDDPDEDFVVARIIEFERPDLERLARADGDGGLHLHGGFLFLSPF
jgi:hypothetical protein